MARTVWKRRGCLFCLLGLAAAVALVPFQGLIWDGGFRSAEYRLTFTDESGRPVPGVKLRVLTQSGGVCHFYPINEFLSEQTPTSDSEGRMVFHHASETLEFSGREYSNLLGMRFGETDSPQYVCVFLLDEREVHRVRYGDLAPRWDHSAKVTREWQHSEWPMREYLAHQDEWYAHLGRVFDANGDGNLDREESTAAGYFNQVMARTERDRGKHDIEFAVVERTIIVRMP